MGKWANKQMGKWGIVLLVLVVSLMFVGRGAILQETYYRGVYESCVWSFVEDGKYTQYALRVCEGIEERARNERWYEKALVRP